MAFYPYSFVNFELNYLKGRNFGGFTHSPNPTHFGGIYFGKPKSYIILADTKYKYFWQEFILADATNNQFLIKWFDRK